jgi:hypothetical protein
MKKKKIRSSSCRSGGDQVTEELQIDNEGGSLIIGPRGNTIQGIQRDTGAKLSYLTSRKGAKAAYLVTRKMNSNISFCFHATVVIINGCGEEVASAKSMVEELLHKHGRDDLIGDWDAHGTHHQRATTKKKMMMLKKKTMKKGKTRRSSRSGGDQVTEELQIDNESGSLIIGPGDNTINGIRRETGAKISFVSPFSVLIINGCEEEVASAKSMVGELLHKHGRDDLIGDWGLHQFPKQTPVQAWMLPNSVQQNESGQQDSWPSLGTPTQQLRDFSTAASSTPPTSTSLTGAAMTAVQEQQQRCYDALSTPSTADPRLGAPAISLSNGTAATTSEIDYIDDEIDDDLVCKICFDAVSTIEFEPCKHSLCVTCDSGWRHVTIAKPSMGTTCPFCRNAITARKKIQSDGSRTTEMVATGVQALVSKRGRA